MSLWLAGAVSVSLVALSMLVVRLRTDVRQLHDLVAHWEAQSGTGPPAPSATSEGWPATAALQPGTRAPASLDMTGAWCLVLFGASHEELGEILPDPPEREGLAVRYRLVAAVPEELGEGLPIPAVAVSTEIMATLPTPAVALVDPTGVVQGLATVESAGAVLGFVFEGEHRGFGPAPVDAEVRAR